MTAVEPAAALRRIAGSGMAYEREGSGPTVVFLHGWSLSGRLWMYARQELADTFDTVVPDLPGLGRSDRLAGPYTVARHAADVGEFLDEAGCDRVHLVGFAYGGAVAMEIAAALPAHVASLTLIGIPKSGELPVDRMLASMRRDWPEYARRSAAAICKQTQSDATLRWLESMFVATRLEVALETWSDISRFDPLTLMPGLAMPTLFIHGAEDDFSPLSVAEEAAAAAPEGRVEVARPSGHLVLLDQPEWLHRTLRSFLTEVS